MAGLAYSVARKMGGRLAKGGGKSAEIIPFSYDPVKQFWHDWGANDNLVDNLGTPTLAVIRERIRKNGAEDLCQPNKAQQFLKTLDGGGHGNLQTNRVMGIGSAPNDVGFAPFSSGRRPKVTNGGNGWYFAGVIKPETGDIWLMEISRAVSSAASRGQCYVTSSRNLMLKGNTTDNATVNAIGNTSSQITFGNKIGIEYLWEFVTDTMYIKIGSVVQAIVAGSETGPWSAFPATDPMQWIFGNQSTLGKSFNGTIYQTIFHDGVPTPEIQASVSAYVTAKAAA